MKLPKKDQTSLGNILMEWGIITKDQLDRALKEQETLRGDDLLGRLLVAGGACTPEEVRLAMAAQSGFRAGGKSKQAMAVADVALERHRRTSIVERRDRIALAGERVQRSITGQSHAALTAAMLAKSVTD